MPRTLFDFSDPEAVEPWSAIDDRVMGGASRSTLQHDRAGHAVFSGRISLEHGGGFASVRSRAADRGWPGAEACVLELRGERRPFKINLLIDDRFDGLVHQAVFEPAGEGWQTLRLPLARFSATFRGREVSGAPMLDPARIRQVGLMIVSRQAGAFRLDIRRIGLE